MRSSRRALVAALGLALLASGCVTRQRDEMVAAREAYHRCVEAHPETHERECAVLQAEAIVEQRRYEKDALHRWGCHDPNHPGCDPRDRTSRSP